MRPLFFSQKIDSNQISLDSEENHHAERVQRTQIGDDIRVADGFGNWSGGKGAAFFAGDALFTE